MKIFLSRLLIYSCLTFYATLNYHTSYFSTKTCLDPSTCHIYSSAVEHGTVQLFLRPSSPRLNAAAGKPLMIVLRMTSLSSSVYRGNGSAPANRCFLKKEREKKSLLSFPEDLEIQLISVRHKGGGLL